MALAPQHRFPPTRPSAIIGMRDHDEHVRARSWDLLTAAYWKPVHAYIRLRWQASAEDADDWTQSFFARAFENGALAKYDASRSAFRTFLRLCVDGHVANVRKYDGRLKRTGSVPLDFEVPAHGDSLDQMFHREWVRNLFSLAIDELRQEAAQRGRALAFHVFELYDLSEPETRPNYAAIASDLSLTETTVTNYLAAMRRDLRKLLLLKLRQLTATDREYRSEARALLGITL